jgi:hypothetical protein
MFIAFIAGIAVGFVLAVAIGVVIARWPIPERTQAPVSFTAIGAGRAVDTNSVGKLPEDWQPIWNPTPRGQA